MNDPWDVKSVRQSGQYVSCMKINGVPLLPPVLSKECRKEMQYYKILAKEVEKRIQLLRPVVPDSDTDEDKTDAAELPQSEQSYDASKGIDSTEFPGNFENIKTFDQDDKITDINTQANNVLVTDAKDKSLSTSAEVVIGLSVNINEKSQKHLEILKKSQLSTDSQADIPVRDCDCSLKTSIDKPKDIQLGAREESPKCVIENVSDYLNFSLSINREGKTSFPELDLCQNGPSSLSSKSFTGSLIDVHAESLKELQNETTLVRQRSYTVLKPSPQLLAHLEVQSLSTGVDVNCISMSDSLSSISPNKKRRSWDLETAKMKWSTMALELKQKNGIHAKSHVSRPLNKPSRVPSPPLRPGTTDKEKCGTLNSKTFVKSPAASKTFGNKSSSPVRNTLSNRTITKEVNRPTPNELTSIKSPKRNTPNSQSQKCSNMTSTPKPLISASEDPATKVRELYEKVQQQQLSQMATLVEKQKKEQMLLQQVFEEQNNLLYKQLKTICPTSPVEVKQAWGEKDVEADHGPVSLSQLINPKSPDTHSNGISSTLTDTNNYINHCEEVLKKSRNITNSLKKAQPVTRASRTSPVRNQSVSRAPTVRSQPNGNTTFSQPPLNKSSKTSTPRRQFKYDSSSSDRGNEPLLTDRTNDTMADINITFTTDDSTSEPFVCNDNTVLNQSKDDISVIRRNWNNFINKIPDPKNCIESTEICYARMHGKIMYTCEPTERERAAATTITAYARGWMVRRLLRTARLQATVRTIRDALLCALALHQDARGIRGADVDLHRRLIQQITAACYSLHEALVSSTPAERCAMLAADRAQRRARAARAANPASPHARPPPRHSNIMSKSFSGSIPARPAKTVLPASMSLSHHEHFSDSAQPRRRVSPRRQWR